MIVISDTTPLISLMKAGHLELVKQLFGEIQIPEKLSKKEILDCVEVLKHTGRYISNKLYEQLLERLHE